MSTRRARIKAVAALPPRRKNARNVETKPEEGPKDLDKEFKSPTVADQVQTQAGSPAPKPRTPARSRKTPVITTVEKPAESIEPAQNSTIDALNKPENIPDTTSAISKSVITDVIETQINLVSSDEDSQTNAESSQTIADKVPTAQKSNDQSTEVTNIPKPSDDKDKEKNTQEANKSLVIEKKSGNKNTASVIENDTTPTIAPENIIDDPMDGIVPLQPAVTRQKPISALKNEIISENAEVLFDPIVPLPSPSKIRPKLRPVPRLAPLRRNSIQQGSASESEDESRRLLMGGSGTPGGFRTRHDSQTSARETSRNRNDSACSSVSMSTGSQVPATSPVKEKVKTRRQEMSRKMAAMRRRKEPVKRDQLTMYDLIFYNPTSNPIVRDENEADKDGQQEIVEDIDADVDEPDEPESQAPVPQIKLGPNGEIVLDEQSLVIKQSNKRKVQSVVHEGPNSTYSRSYRRAKRTAEWTPSETVRFYRALATMGTDFSLMESLFPGRVRRDLKLKFKKEEKQNCAQVDKAIRSKLEWNPMRLLKEFEEERELEARKLEEKKEQLLKEKKEQQLRKQAAKELRVRHSRSAKTLGNSIMPPAARKDNVSEPTTADEIIAHAVKTRKRRKQVEETVTKPNPKRNPEPKVAIPANPIPRPSTPQLPTLTLIKNTSNSQSPKRMPETDMPDLSDGPIVTTNVEDGSLVVLSVNDPNSPSKKMLQTYIAHASGKLKPIALNPALLNSVVGYMKRSTPRSSSARSSPLLMSPSNVSVVSAESKDISTPLTLANSSPSKKSNYSITPL